MRCNNPFAFRPGPVSFWTTVIYLAVVIPIIYVHETVPPAPSDYSLFRGLNLTEAWLDLETISNSYHPYNTHQNDLVREFLVNRSKEILSRNDVEYKTDTSAGVPWNELLSSPTDDSSGEFVNSVAKPPGATLFDDQTSNVTWTYGPSGDLGSSFKPSAWAGHYFEGNNFYVYIHGKEDPEGDWWLSESEYKKAHGKGGVLVNCHFDSVATGYGATDDGMACVSMLQMLSYFTSSGRQPRNGIVLLFNNAEEDGLLGARAFGNSPLLQFCHTFVNLEGAGAGGRAMLFRATDLEAAKAYSGSPHPFGSVTAANAFESGVIKSGTDYEIFTEFFGQRGMDIAFYQPRARYHTEDDDARHSSVNSIWHMLSAALASTERLSETTGTDFNGPRPDDNKNLVQNGRPTAGVWFDMLGSAWVVFALKGLFAWSLTLLVAAPLVLLVVTTILVRSNKYYYFSGDVKIHSEVNDDPVALGGWKGFFRFPLALVFAGGLTVASVFLLAKFNPLIVYSSDYAVWAMTLSIFYFAFWLIMRGSSFVRPSALHRGFANIWLFALGWAIQVFAAVAEDRLHIGALYFAAFLQSGIFVSLAISLLEQFALLRKRDFAMQQHDAHQARDYSSNHPEPVSDGDAPEEEHPEEADEEDDEEDNDDDAESPTETTPLRAGEQDYGSNDQPTFANAYRRSASSPSAPKMRRYAPYNSEQSWSGRLPTWTWILQFLLLAPVPILLIGNLGLVAMSSLNMTGTDGGNLLTPIMTIGIMSIMLLLPITPFMHRITHHVPIFLLLVFVGTLVYNLVAFPFSVNHRFKFYFQQVIDLDDGMNYVSLDGIEEFVRPVIDALPIAAGQKIECKGSAVRFGLSDCRYEASSLPPNFVDGKKPEELVSVNITRSSNGAAANMLIDALDTRLCYLDFSGPIYGFSVEGGGGRDLRFGPSPPHGLQHLQLWRRDWERPWNVTLQLTENGKASEASPEMESTDELVGNDELKARSGAGTGLVQRAEPLQVKVRCAWSDANKPSTIPAFHELRKYMPTWSVASKRTVGLVEVRKTYEVSA